MVVPIKKIVVFLAFSPPILTTHHFLFDFHLRLHRACCSNLTPVLNNPIAMAGKTN
jgi:hypothetical protein